MFLIPYKDALIPIGFPKDKDKVYYLWQKKLDKVEPIRSPTELIINEDGVLVIRADGKVVSVHTVDFARGEALQVALMSEDKTIMVFYKDIPYPIENKQGDYRIWVELWSPEGDTFIIWGEGFEPDEEIDTTSTSDGEVIKSKTKVNSDGQFMTIISPAVVGKEDGLATFSAVGKSGEVKVSYQWGLPALRSVTEVELKYDDGQSEIRLSAGPSGGYLVEFSPLAIPFTITNVRMFGVLAGSDWQVKNFEVEIWDKDYQVLHSAIYPVTEFPVGTPNWVEVEVPNIRVTDKFYVHIYTGTGRGQGIHIGADDSVVNEHSDLAIRTAEGVTKIRSDWPYPSGFWWSDKSKVNWMIRVVGTAMLPPD